MGQQQIAPMTDEVLIQKAKEESGKAGVWMEEEDLYDKRETKEELIPLVIFRLGREWYGVEISKVKEIIKVSSITYLPSSPEYVLGIVNYRGNILSVMDLRKILGLPPGESDEISRIMIIESDQFSTGFLVDEGVESVEINKSQVSVPLLTLPSEGAKYIKGQFKSDDKLVAILHVERILRRGT